MDGVARSPILPSESASDTNRVVTTKGLDSARRGWFGAALSALIAVAVIGCSSGSSKPDASYAGDSQAPEVRALDAADAPLSDVGIGADGTTDHATNDVATTDTTGDVPADLGPVDAATSDAPSADASPSDAPATDASGAPDAIDATDAPLSLTATTVAQIHAGVVLVGAAVSLTNVYVTAVDAQRHNLWISDAAVQSAGTGIYVFRGASAGALDASVVSGTRVNLGAVVASFHGLLELAPLPSGSVSLDVVAGNPAAIVPVTVPLADVASNPLDVGSVVRVANVKVTASAVAGSAHVYTLSDGTTTVQMGEQLVTTGATVGTCYASATSVLTLDTTTDPGTPLLLPRTIVDLSPGGVCP